MVFSQSKAKFSKIIEHSFFKDRVILLSILVHLGLNLTNWAILFFGLKSFRGYPVPIHYTILGGVDLLGEWYKLLLLPLTGGLILIINAALGFFSYKREKLLSFLLVGVGLLCQVLLLVISLAFLKLVRG